MRGSRRGGGQGDWGQRGEVAVRGQVVVRRRGETGRGGGGGGYWARGRGRGTWLTAASLHMINSSVFGRPTMSAGELVYGTTQTESRLMLILAFGATALISFTAAP